MNKDSYLADKVSILVLLLERDNILPDIGISTFIRFASALQFGNDGLPFLLLSQVLFESQSIVFLLWLSLSAWAAFRLVAFRRGSGSVCSWSSPGVGISCRIGSTPGVGGGGSIWSTPFTGGSLRGVCAPFVRSSTFGSSVVCSGFLGLELGVAVIATPRLMEFLVRVTGWIGELESMKLGRMY
jgi:hypothetical protein